MQSEKQNSHDLKLIKGLAGTDYDKLKCFSCQLKSIEFMSLDTLFKGYNTIRAITFSFDISFIDQVMEYFDYGELIFGGEFLVLKDNKLNELVISLLTDAEMARNAIRNQKRLFQMMSEGNLKIKTPQEIIDHRKVYLLHADSGKTRVILSSANMTRTAWNGNQMENYHFFDDSEIYDEYMREFETMWAFSADIPLSIVSAQTTDDKDLIENNPVLRRTKETEKVVVFKQQDSDRALASSKYVIDHENLHEKFCELFKGVRPKEKDGLIQLTPRTLEQLQVNLKKIQAANARIERKADIYPRLTFDMAEQTALLNGSPLDLHPSHEEIQTAVRELLSIYENFNEFVGDPAKLKNTHFKLMNALFASPFCARLRCTAHLRNIGTNPLPLFMLVSSSTSNPGKTFMIDVALKMMTGKTGLGINKEGIKKDQILGMQQKCQGVPIFIDEIDNKSFSTISSAVKNADYCEKHQLENQPLIVFASNDVLDPKEYFRKRMVFLRMEGGLPSSVDQSAYSSRGKAILGRVTQALYREYLRRMLPVVSEMLDYMIYNRKDIPDVWYPDLFGKSSEILVSIIKDCGYNVPDYMKVMTWNEDYSVNAKFIAGDTLEKIMSLYRKDRSLFHITKDTVTIELGSEGKKTLQSWQNTLPTEMEAKLIPGRERCTLIINRSELEKKLQIRFGRRFLFWKG